MGESVGYGGSGEPAGSNRYGESDEFEIMVTFGGCGGIVESGGSDRPGKFGDFDDTSEFGDFAVGDFVELKYCNQIMKIMRIDQIDV